MLTGRRVGRAAECAPHPTRPSFLPRLKGYSAWLARSRPRPGTPVAASAEKLAVQGELSLDRVKVVRNDLSDTEVEVVPSRSPLGAPADGSRLSRAATHLLSVNKS